MTLTRNTFYDIQIEIDALYTKQRKQSEAREANSFFFNRSSFFCALRYPSLVRNVFIGIIDDISTRQYLYNEASA